jgi:hypothetical protein
MEDTMQIRQLVSPNVSAGERRQVLKWLDESHQEFCAGVSGHQLNWKPAPERWSVGETAEHIVLAEALLFGFIRKALSAEPNPVWEEQTKSSGSRS